MKKMVSGIQPTNNLTLGNYLGAIKNFVKLQEKYEMYIFIADLHAITTIIDKELKQNKINIAKTYIAVGLDPKKVHIFNQSEVLEHALLGYILLCNTTIGELSRMTQYKDKSLKAKKSNGTDFIPSGLLTYPALMAADILLYNADIVVVGQDQKQHLELTRNIAERINNKYNKKIFNIVEPIINDIGCKIMDLQDPSKKMSKSSENIKGTIFLTDDEEIITKKIMGAITDNYAIVKYDLEKQPGISNLLNIYSSIADLKISEIEKKYTNIENYKIFKEDLTKIVISEIKKIQTNISKISNSDIEEILAIGSKEAKSIASKNLEIIKKEMGI